MRTCATALFSLLLVSCSCHRTPPQADTEAATTPSASATVPASSAPSASTDTATPSAAISSPGGSTVPRQASAVVHEYVATLLNDRESAGRFWAGERLPPHPDDAVLHDIANIRNLRVDNDAGIALDRETPAQAVEIPVRIRISTEQGPRQLRGWYRVRPRIGSDDWEITSASLQPVLD